MYGLAFISVIILLSFIVYEDIKYRGVFWWVFPALFIASIALSYYFHGEDWLLADWLYSSLFLLVIVSTSHSALVLLRGANWKSLLGIGDVLFFAAIIPLFSTQLFLIFLSFSFIASLMLHGLFGRLQTQKTVPLAGYQSIVLILYLCVQFFSPSFFQNLAYSYFI
ncbi:MAG: hypothetical protein KDC83_06700 [Flavobacteriales bacterium]|nr:hypothetical protein [Flavobacteriales bacterium]